jgi:hypothetical protein
MIADGILILAINNTAFKFLAAWVSIKDASRSEKCLKFSQAYLHSRIIKRLFLKYFLFKNY